MKIISNMFKALFGVVIFLLVFALAGHAVAQTWTLTGNLNTARAFHAMFLLSDGRVLAAGDGDTPTNTAELYNPATGIWAFTGSTTQVHTQSTAVRLKDGRVLLTGGRLGPLSLNTAEIYDPATGTWSVTGSINKARGHHTATLLQDGKVLVTGGYHHYEGWLKSAEIWDPLTGTWSFTASMPVGAWRQTATLLPDGRVLVAGGENYNFCYPCSTDKVFIYNPATNTWSTTGNLNAARACHHASLLSNGKVLVAGGYTIGSPTLNTAELYDPDTGAWSYTGSLNAARILATLTLLADGRLLIAGGDSHLGKLDSVEQYDPTTGTWTLVASLNQRRHLHAAVLLADGRVLVSGGHDGSFFLNTAEIFGPSLLPVANAGPDQTVDEGTPVTLDGSQSTGQNLTFNWTQLAGPEVALSDPTNPKPTFTSPSLLGGFGSQVLTFQLTVTSGSQSSSDTVDITVRNVNHAPVAEAGDAQIVNEGSLVTLNGSGSYDPDGDPITYNWVQISGTPVTLTGWDTANPTFTAPLLPGGLGGTEILIFELTISDTDLSSTDNVQVIVEQVNHPPIANAGPDQTRNEGSLVTLNGTLSYDPDGDPLTYNWFQTAGPPVILSNAQSPSPSFTAPAVGPGGETLVFQLIVNDPLTPSDPDTVVVTVQNVNDPPACQLAQASPSLLWPPNHKLIPVGILGVADPNNDQVTVTITGVTQDELVNGLEDGDTSPDAVIQGDKVLIRAERSGIGNGRVYRIYFTANDGRVDGVCNGEVTVGVPLSMKKGAFPVDDGQLYNSTIP